MRGALVIIMLLLFLGSVYGLGLSYEFLEDKTLSVPPGTEYDFKITLQNEQDEKVTVRITVSSDVGKLVGREKRTIPAKTFDSVAYIKIRVPKDAEIGTLFPLNFTVAQESDDLSYNRELRVLVSEDADEADATAERSIPSFYVHIVGAVAVFLVLFFVPMRKRKKQTEEVVIKEESPKPVIEVKSPTEEPEILLVEKDEKKTFSSEHYFAVHHGNVLKDLSDLYIALQSMSAESFEHHVNEHNNDFSNWVEHVLENKDLAQKLRSTRNQEEMVGFVGKEL